MKNNTLETMKQMIEKSNHLLLVSHILPDGDNIGSVLGMTLSLRMLGKKVVGVINGALPKYYEFLPFVDTLIHPDEIPPEESFDLILALDMSDHGRGGDALESLWGRCPVINIDHHVSNDYFGDYNYVDASAASTAEIMTELLLAWGYPLSKEIATALYVGMLTDSGNFTYDNTSVKTLSMATEVMKYEPDLVSIRMNVFENVSFKRKKILGQAINNAKELKKYKIVYSTLDYEECVALEAEGQDFEGIIDHLIGITDVKFGIFFREMKKGVVKVGFRGKPGVDVTVVAGEFGGGGHKAAGGCSLEGDFSSSVEKVMKAAMDYMEGKN